MVPSSLKKKQTLIILHWDITKWSLWDEPTLVGIVFGNCFFFRIYVSTSGVTIDDSLNVFSLVSLTILFHDSIDTYC